MRHRPHINGLFSLLLVLPACHGHVDETVEVVAFPRNVSIDIEVYDPVTNFVWQDVDVRIVEGFLEWSGLTLQNPNVDDWFRTNEFGTVFFDATELANAQIGFVEDAFQRAVLEPELDRDEAFVQVEISAPGIPSVFADIQLSWDNPDVFISIPF